MRTYDLPNRTRERKYQALYQSLKEDILSGAIAPGEKLPSRRALAEHLGVSPVTVESAYNLLIDEGYVYAKPRSGCYALPIQGMTPRRHPAGSEPLQLLPEESVEPLEMDFPYSLWFRTLRKVITNQGRRLVARSPNKGCAVLRNALARYLVRYRGMAVQPAQIVVGSGAEQLYEAVVRMLGRERVYAIEWPSYGQIETVYKGAGAVVERLPMGRDGITSGALAASSGDVLHVTPFHSWPTGITALASKRYEYLRWADRPGRYVVEDDFDSEFFMPGQPLESLYSMDKRGSVIYINTFSKSLTPAVRMGYMILPETLLPVYEARVGMYSCSVPVLEQYALADFLDEGHFERHLNRVRRRLKEKAEVEARK